MSIKQQELVMDGFYLGKKVDVFSKIHIHIELVVYFKF